MKVTVRKSTEQPKFEPIDLIIKIETEEELELIRALAYTNVSIPEAVSNNSSSIKSVDVKIFLAKLQEALYGL